MPKKRKTHLIPRVTAARLVSNAGAELVSDDTAILMSELLEDYARIVAARAVEIAKHSKRRTIMEGDVKLAAQ